jgi:nitroreductase
MASSNERAQIVLGVIRTRRAIRAFDPAPVPTSQIRQVIEAGRWASSASNRRVHRFLVIRNARRLRLVQALAPGMATVPPVLIVLCTDMAKLSQAGVKDQDVTTWIDVGTAAMTMMIAAHALGLGTCPVTSFSGSGVGTILDLPISIRPELLLMLGTASPESRTGVKAKRLDPEEITDWEGIGGVLSEGSTL